MAITYDNATTGTPQGAGGSTWSFSHTVGSGTNRYLLVGFTHYGGNTGPFSATYNGVAMDICYSCHVAAWMTTIVVFGLKNPDSGAHNVIVSPSAGTLGQCAGGAVSFSGVAQTTSFHNAATIDENNTQAPDITITSAAGEVAFAHLHVGSNITVSSRSQTERYSCAGGVNHGGYGDTANGAATVNFLWNLNAQSNCSMIGLSLLPAVEADGSITFTQVRSP